MIRQRLFSRAIIASAMLLIPVAAVITNSGTASAVTCDPVVQGDDWSNTCPVQEGADSNAVVAIQVAATLESPVCNTNIDGDFGPSTLAEVECFQRAMGIQPNNGIVDSETWGAMHNRLTFEGRSSDGNWSYWSTTGCGSTACANFRKWLGTSKNLVRPRLWQLGADEHHRRQ